MNIVNLLLAAFVVCCGLPLLSAAVEALRQRGRR